MNVKEAYISIGNEEEIFCIIAETLKGNLNTQVYVATEVFGELDRNGHNHHVFKTNYYKTFHYSHDGDNFGGETWYQLTAGNAFSETIARASFISNCQGYGQLVQYVGEGIKEYTHYISGFEQLLLIYYKK